MEKMISKNVVLGVLIVIVGVAFLLSNLGIISCALSHIIISWQMLLILLGIGNLSRRRYIGGLLLIAVGVVFLMPRLSTTLGFYYSAAMLHAVIWPLVVIAIGLIIIFHKRQFHHHCRYNEMKSKIDSNNGKVDYNLIMNGIDEVFLQPVFHGGEISTIMGGAKLDLRRTSLPEGDTVLKISSICGGVTLLIPLEWNVEIKSDSILGGFADHRHGNGACVNRRLIIEASFIFGGGSIE